ncbi:MAG: T9SS type A sorting domain-containing protein [Bacteroidota bacterium]|nr:T9SS type A sorting domain-containing protein [Bacteroidota bacterium]
MNKKFNAIRVTILGIMLMVSISLKATTYYFSSSTGSDNNTASQATNQATPWKTINKLNSIMSTLRPGDMVLFKRGETFPGTINLTVSGAAGNPITFGAYGSGTAKPILDNRLTLTGWTSLGGNIWETSNSALQSQPTALFINNTPMPLGRYPNIDAPNGGYLTIASHSSGTVFTGTSIPSSLNFTGAEAVIRSDHYLLNRRTVASQSGQTITLTSDVYITDGYGFFFQNSPAALDKDGEWCYIASSKKVRIYSATDPNTRVIQVSNTDNYFNILGYSYIVIDGLSMYGAKSCDVNLSAATFCTIKNCFFYGSGTNSINVGYYGATNNDSINIRNNSFTKVQSNCINAFGTRLSLTGNTLTNIGTVPGMAESGQYSVGMCTLANGLDIEGNVLDSLGNSGIMFAESNNVLIKGNSLNHFCSVLDDEGGIYCYNGNPSVEPVNRKVINNIVVNGIGAVYGTSNQISPVEGIYIDDRSANVEINGNTVAFCANSGIFLHNSPKCQVLNNTVFSCRKDLWICHYVDPSTFNLVGYDIEKNVFASIASARLLFYETNETTPLSNVGKINNNIYCQPFLTSDFITFYSPSAPDGLFLKLPDWKSYSGFDLNSTLSPITYPSTITNQSDYYRFEYNTTTVSRSITADKNYITPAGVTYLKGSTINVPAFGSVLLLKSDIALGVTPNIPAESNSFKLYPNPADDKVYIQTEESSHPIDVTFYDLSGKQIKREIVNTGSAMDVQSLPKGFYVISVLDKDKTRSLKLIKR